MINQAILCFSCLRNGVHCKFIICASKVASLSKPAMKHFLGQDLPVAFIQCCFQDPHLHERFPVPVLFFQPSAGNDIEYLPLFVNSSQNSELIQNQPQSLCAIMVGFFLSINWARRLATAQKNRPPVLFLSHGAGCGSFSGCSKSQLTTQ